MIFGLATIFFMGLLSKAAPLWAQGMSVPDADPKPGNAPQPGVGVEMTDIHDIKPVLAVGYEIAPWLWAVAGLALLIVLALGIFLWRRRRRLQNEWVQASVVAPDVLAFHELDALAAENLSDGKSFYFRLSAILRLYLQGRYQVAAAEMTTEELLPVADRFGWPVELTHSLRAFCRFTDPVKFAHAPADRERMAQDLAFVRQLISQTRVPEVDPDGGPESIEETQQSSTPLQVETISIQKGRDRPAQAAGES